MARTLILIDIQNDFTEGGSLAVPDGNKIIPIVNQLQFEFDHVVATQDWHPQSHGSFASNHPGKKPFDVIDLDGLKQTLWPDHCVQGSFGAEFHPDLETRKIASIFRKGMDPNIDSYSGFFDNGRRKQTGLKGYLTGLGLHALYFCGLALDYCVYYSIKDALEEGFDCFLYVDATRAISVDQQEEILEELTRKGVHLL